jgi:hypothetical protein
MIWLVVVLVAVFLLAAPFLGADSRDGRDWRPLRLPSPVPDTSRPPLAPTGARQAAKELRAKLTNLRTGRHRNIGRGRMSREQVRRLMARSWGQNVDVIGRRRPSSDGCPVLAEVRPAKSMELD